MTVLEHLLNIQNILARQRAELLKAKSIICEMQNMTDGLQGVNYENSQN